MRTCLICDHEIVLDDVALWGITTWCVCVRCYHRKAGGALIVPRWLQEEAEAASENTDDATAVAVPVWKLAANRENN